MSFSHKNLTTPQLQDFELKIIEKFNSPTIKDVYFKSLKRHVDSRGDLTELWSQPWSKKEPIENKIKHVYYNTTHQGVIKAWHVHEHTTSQYTCVQGKMQVVLIDVRPNSSTFKHVNLFLIGTYEPAYIKISAGVLKGWKSIQGDSIIINLLTSDDLKDNYKYPWDCILTNTWLPKNG